LSEWSLAIFLDWGEGREKARLLGRIPDVNFYRFKTPAPKADSSVSED
jgi:hypothetical protein